MYWRSRRSFASDSHAESTSSAVGVESVGDDSGGEGHAGDRCHLDDPLFGVCQSIDLRGDQPAILSGRRTATSCTLVVRSHRPSRSRRRPCPSRSSTNVVMKRGFRSSIGGAFR